MCRHQSARYHPSLFRGLLSGRERTKRELRFRTRSAGEMVVTSVTLRRITGEAEMLGNNKK
jgi:hypothetical protein